MVIRIIDFILALAGLILLSPVLIVIFIALFITCGAPFIFQERVGQNKKYFLLLKFRTMKIATKAMPTHLADKDDITHLGRVLRKTKLDELPQLYNVLLGEMSLVGPRPSLASQLDVIMERERRDIFLVKPGITGLSQIQKVDMSDPKKLAQFDEEMVSQLTIKYYFKMIFLTLLGRGLGDRINY